MPYKLFKIAKELNVATSTIVEYLSSQGFEIENKPTAKISDEIHEILLDRFSSAMVEKERAEALLEERRKRREKTVQPEKTIEKPEPPKIEEEEKKEEKQPETKQPEEKEEVQKPKLKVVGKIDLDQFDKKKKEEKKAKEKKQEDKKTEEKKVEKKQPEEKTPDQKTETVEKEIKEEPQEKKKKVEKTEKEDDVVRAEAPELRGLKHLGKIDLSKFEKKKKPKAEQQTKDSKTKPASQEGATKKRRKRKRRKVNPNMSGAHHDKKRQNKPKEEVKEISEKEIEDKIKATMAKLKSGIKSKRQKIRKESKITKREKHEVVETTDSKVLEVSEFITVSELASVMNVPVTDIIMTCMNLGVIVSINQRIEKDIIELVSEEFGYEVNFIAADEIDDFADDIIDDEEDLVPRAPIVTVMGHVDHGKTSLLDFIRKENVVDGEAGGITQHVGAYEVNLGPGKTITFLDTPGHEAFTAMRARGAKVTDLVIIVVAADDKIMPQTKEAISHSQAAGVPMIFAINKIDKPGADPERIKQELASMNLLVEEWGGKYQSQDLSAKTGQGVSELLEKVFLEAELLELKANPNRLSIGTVLEATLDKGKGYVSNVLVQNGTLKIGSVIVAGSYYGKVKAMFNDKGKRIKKAGPSKPVKILGMNGAAQAGERFKEYENEKDAKNVAAKIDMITREQQSRSKKRISLEEIGRRLKMEDFKELNLIVKADMDGTAEALSDSLIKLSIDELQVNVIHKGVGQISESDVLLASASDAIIIGFQVRPSGNARKIAEKEGVEIKTYSIIYEAIDQVKLAMQGMLEPTEEERIKG
ncbi:MAG TPA: translation initiation factor IF-2, partial [Bacteroidetes bacterium]|nr:translation initiation factor IF-2 [Bacteroidota bacterium]